MGLDSSRLILALFLESPKEGANKVMFWMGEAGYTT